MADIINAARAQACGLTPLRESRRLDEVASLLSRGLTLVAAQDRAGYHSMRIVSVLLSGVTDPRSIGYLMRARLCSQLGTPGLTELGAERRGEVIWVALAEPFEPPDPREMASISRRVLELTNEARSQPRRCGGVLFPAAPPLTLDPRLVEAARVHSRDMAAHGYLAHTGRDGSTPADRVTRTGYLWRLVGENVASGSTTAEAVVADWLGSPHHCENIMTAGYRQMGVAFAVNLDTEGGVYWTQVFAAGFPGKDTSR